jgi:hypothetical protein
MFLVYRESQNELHRGNCYKKLVTSYRQTFLDGYRFATPHSLAESAAKYSLGRHPAGEQIPQGRLLFNWANNALAMAL